MVLFISVYVYPPLASNVTEFRFTLSVNQAPVFRLPPAPLKIFKGQKWRYEVPVQDPEKRPMKYEFIGESHGMEISSAGVITWTPKEVNKTYDFTVKATDPCGKSAEGKFSVQTRGKFLIFSRLCCSWNSRMERIYSS